MNRQQALEWLVENVTKWPDATDLFRTANDPYGWIMASCTESGDTVFIAVSVLINEGGIASETIITQQDWLDATDNMEKKEDE